MAEEGKDKNMERIHKLDDFGSVSAESADDPKYVAQMNQRLAEKARGLAQGRGSSPEFLNSLYHNEKQVEVSKSTEISKEKRRTSLQPEAQAIFLGAVTKGVKGIREERMDVQKTKEANDNLLADIKKLRIKQEQRETREMIPVKVNEENLVKLEGNIINETRAQKVAKAKETRTQEIARLLPQKPVESEVIDTFERQKIQEEKESERQRTLEERQRLKKEEEDKFVARMQEANWSPRAKKRRTTIEPEITEVKPFEVKKEIPEGDKTES